MKDNPFKTVAKKGAPAKPKLTSFKAAAKKSKPATTKANGKVSPFTKIAKIGTADPRKEQLIKLKEEIPEVAAKLEVARKDEAKKFKPVDKLALRDQTNNDKYKAAHDEWNEASMLVTRLNNRLLGMCQTRRVLEEQIKTRSKR